MEFVDHVLEQGRRPERFVCDTLILQERLCILQERLFYVPQERLSDHHIQ